ncbi:hypothetical protein B0H19DRAFT_1077445 [Mycena capillaripes]|nr:hypothetical protein B0H19DRAFT_1077445 [Mycena capillaripes]
MDLLLFGPGAFVAGTGYGRPHRRIASPPIRPQVSVGGRRTSTSWALASAGTSSAQKSVVDSTVSSCGHAVVKNTTKSMFASRTTSLRTPSKRHCVGKSQGDGGGKKVPRRASNRSAGAKVTCSWVRESGDSVVVAYDISANVSHPTYVAVQSTSTKWREVTRGVVSLGVGAIDGEEPLTGRSGGGVLDEFSALGRVVFLKDGVHRDGEGAAGFGKVEMDFRDTNEFTDEGCVGDEPKVAEDDRKHNFQLVAADEHPLGHTRVAMSVACWSKDSPRRGRY